MTHAFIYENQTDEFAFDLDQNWFIASQGSSYGM
jgi:hypothetical protein